MTESTIRAMHRFLEPADAAPLIERVIGAVRAVYTSTGADPTFGDKLPAHLLDAGLVKVAAQVCAPVTKGGSDRAFIPLSLAHLEPVLVGQGLLSAGDYQAIQELLAQPSTRYVPLPVVMAWGQRPHTESEPVS
jgi:hypothetical protein